MPRFHGLGWIVLSGLVAGGAAFASEDAARSSADLDWAALESARVIEFKLPEAFFAPGLSGKDHSAILEGMLQVLRKEGLAFYENHPTDPRRWIVVEKMLIRPPRFIVSYGTKFEQDHDDVVIDSAAAKAWEMELETMRIALNAATDVPAGVHERLDAWSLSRELGSLFGISEAQWRLVNWELLISKVRAFAAMYPDSLQAPGLLQYLMQDFESRNSPEKIAAVWEQFADSPNKAVAAQAQERLRLFDLMIHPLKWKFVAADGRSVDVEKMRGKVVLIDFWATWCGPCKLEIPNLRKVYSDHHDQGFEVIGVAIEDSHVTSVETVDQTSASIEEARRHLLGFTTANGMVWPEYFDGKFWNTDVAVKYAVKSVPAMLLFDQEGKLVNSHARGEELERDVRRLLRL